MSAALTAWNAAACRETLAKHSSKPELARTS